MGCPVAVPPTGRDGEGDPIIVTVNVKRFHGGCILIRFLIEDGILVEQGTSRFQTDEKERIGLDVFGTGINVTLEERALDRTGKLAADLHGVVPEDCPNRL